MYNTTRVLRVISGLVHAQHFCGGKRVKLYWSRLSTISKFASIQFIDTLSTSDGYFWGAQWLSGRVLDLRLRGRGVFLLPVLVIQHVNCFAL